MAPGTLEKLVSSGPNSATTSGGNRRLDSNNSGLTSFAGTSARVRRGIQAGGARPLVEGLLKQHPSEQRILAAAQPNIGWRSRVWRIAKTASSEASTRPWRINNEAPSALARLIASVHAGIAELDDTSVHPNGPASFETVGHESVRMWPHEFGTWSTPGLVTGREVDEDIQRPIDRASHRTAIRRSHSSR